LSESGCCGDSNLTYAKAVSIQKHLRAALELKPPEGRIRRVAGADVGFTKDGQHAIAGFVLFSWGDLEVVDVALASRKVDFPYIPGLLSFREIPVLVAAYRRLEASPDVIFCDGQGLAHPRRFGLASHLGVLLSKPTIGCAKSVLVGTFKEPGARRGSRTNMTDEDECVGCALRTRDNVREMYISPGHMMDTPTAARLVLEAGRGYRLPEPTRAAHNLVARAKEIHRK